ncbi:50S ribosome-binding GTPase [Candidatus Pacearchaeota archaeon]|nr:50S ribosome-binding GTPase [Candidatus Pacearchaeota archaeon]
MYHPTTRQQEGFKGSPIARDILGYWEVIEKIVKECDVILEVLDARMPEISRNEQIEKLVKDYSKELIFVMNKADLISRMELEKRRKELRKIADCVYVSSTNDYDLRKLKALLFKDFSEIKNRFGKLKIGIVGYPNTGKSSLINALTKRKSAKVSKRAGTTHGVQWIKFGENALIMDSPGVIPIGERDIISEGLLGAKDPERIPNAELVAFKIIEIGLKRNRNALEKFFDININDPDNDPQIIIEQIAIKRNYLKKGGLPDINRAVIYIIRSWTGGELRF